MNRLLSLFVLSLSQLVLFSQAGWAADGPIPLQQVQEEETKYTLTLNSQPANACSFNRSSGQTFTAGQSVYMYYNARTDYVFEYWQSEGEIVSRDRYFYFTMPNHDATLTAVFRFDPTNPENPNEATKKYTLTLNTQPANAGYFNHSSGEQFAAGQSVSLRAYNNTDYVFSHWTENGEQIATNASFSYTMPERNAELTAVYDYQPGNPADPDTAQVYYTVTLETQPANAGSFSWNSTTKAIARSSCYVYAYTNTDYVFREWQQDGKQVSTSQRYDFQMPAENIKLVAVYDYNPANPGNPGKNYWNEETGEVIVDDFTPGSLSSAVSNTIGGSSNRDKVQMMTIAGPISQYDWGVVNSYPNCTMLDLSRTYGMTYVPSYNFSGNTVLTAVVLPAGIETIDYYAFRNCTALSSLSIYAATPPTIGNRAFEGIPEGLIVYVPADALSLYQEAEGWKDFTILPLANQVSSLEVNLSSDANFDTTPYKDMFIELINTVSGQKLRYVITNRVNYTFNSLPKRTNYNVYLRNAQGDVLGRIDDVAVGYDGQDDPVSVTFAEVKVPRDLMLTIHTPEGEDVTGQTAITWFDQKDTYLTKGNTLTGQLEGISVKYRVQLPQALAMLYQLPADATYEVQATNAITLTLTAIPQTTIGGRVLDIKTGQPLSGATVAVSQMLNGLYSKSFTTKTDNTGLWSLLVYEAKSDVTASMDDYVSKTQSFETLVAEVPDFELKDISGTTISIGLTYQPTGGELQEFYSDYANVAYTVYNETTSQAVTELNVQYPQIVLMEQLPAGTVLRVTATSKNQKFMPVTASATVDSLDRASVTLPIKQLGGITASFRQTDNPSVVGILYDGNGRLLKKYDYATATLTISELQDGQYTLVTMASTQLFNSVGSIAQFAGTGLREGIDYVKNTVTVKSGENTVVENQLIPFLDETKLYYTGDGTSITVNKTQITTGNYLTITGHLDFKPAYADQVSDVKLIVDLPEESAFVDNSVMRGAQTATYTYADGQVIVPLDYYGERVRFCFIPTAGGDFTATGSVQFTLGGKTITQPIGNANFTVKDLSISVPSTVAKTTVPVSGIAVGRSSVEVYDNSTLVGQTKALANGAWATTVELNNPYNLSTHSLYAKITTKDGVEMQSETKDLTYDMNAIQIQKVTMYHYNPEMHTTFESVFDFQNPHTTPNQWTVYYPNKKFTYTVDFTNNSPEKVSNVILYVHAADGQIVPLYPTYDEKKDIWVADIDMGNRSDGYYPVNVSIDYDVVSEPLVDTRLFVGDLKQFEQIGIDFKAELEKYTSEWNDDIEDVTDESEFLSFEELMKWDADFVEEDTEEINVDSLMQICSAISNLFVLSRDEEIKMPDGSIALVKSCSGISESELEGLGYEKYETIENKAVYVLNTEGSSIMIDFADDLYLEIKGIPSENPDLARYASGLDVFNDWVSKIQGFYMPIRDAYEDLESMIGSLVSNLEYDFEKFSDLVNKHQKTYKSFSTKLANAEALKNSGTLDPWQLNEIDAKIASYKASKAKYKKLLDTAKRSKWLTEKTLPVVRKLAPQLKQICPLLKYADMIAQGVKVIYEYRSLYMSVPNPCPNDPSGADRCRTDVRNGGSWVFGLLAAKLGTQALLDIGVASQAVGSVATGGITLVTAFATAVGKMVLGIALDTAFDQYNTNKQNSLKAEINALKCKKDPDPDPDPNPGGGGPGGGGSGGSGGSGGGTGSGSSNDGVKIDPSGFVYEGVSSNRLQGVTATAYYKETVEDMYGDLHENIVLWDAEEYAQENPLFTDEYGMYQWDVPQGLWQVKFEKEGYQTTYSEWLPVPPPQLEVNIAMTQLLQPSVKSGLADSKGVEVTFDKYMDPETLTADNIIVTKNGEKITDGTIELLDEEVAYEGKTETFASKVRFNVAEGDDNLLLSTDEVMLTVKKAVKSYAGVQMENDYTQKFDVEPRVASIAVDELFNIGYGTERTITVAALPADASKGKTMKVQSLSTMIATVSSDELTLDENGQAELTISGELPGSTVINFQVEGTDVEGQTTVNVKDATLLVTVAPRASRVSGTEVYRGTEIRLTSETDGAVIYYTLDGSCPCNTETALVYNPDQPIIITDDNVTIKAMAQGRDLAESEVTEFSYTLKKTTLGYQLPAGWTWISHNVEEGIPASTFQTGAERIVSQTQETIKDPQYGFIGSLTELQPATGYKVKLATSGNVRVTGYEWNAAQNSVSVETGWNWIGYPVNQTMTLQDALAYYTPNEGDYIVGQNGFSEYANGAWHGTLENMTPSTGYLYKSAAANEIQFNTAIVSVAATRKAKRTLLTGSPWAADSHAYPNVMPLTAWLYADGVKAGSDEFIVAAFDGSECRGVGQWQDGRLMMNIVGEGGEELHFMAYDPQTEQVYDIAESLTFESDNIGSWNMPYSLTLGGTTVGIGKLYHSLTVTPRVVRDNISVAAGGQRLSHVALTDMSGRTVLSMDVSGKETTVNTNSLPEGIYIVTVVADGNSYYQKIVKSSK